MVLDQRAPGFPRPQPQAPLGVFACPRKKVPSRISSRLETDPLRLLSVFIDHRPVGEVQINGSDTEAPRVENLR